MDPTANLAEQLRLADSFMECEEEAVAGLGDLSIPRLPDPDDVVRLAELVIALNEWITKGGFLPAQWQHRGRNEEVAAAPDMLVAAKRAILELKLVVPLRRAKTSRRQDEADIKGAIELLTQAIAKAEAAP